LKKIKHKKISKRKTVRWIESEKQTRGYYLPLREGKGKSIKIEKEARESKFLDH
jgi:hypothetical protein